MRDMTEAKLKALFDFQKFEQEPKLQGIIDNAKSMGKIVPKCALIAMWVLCLTKKRTGLNARDAEKTISDRTDFAKEITRTFSLHCSKCLLFFAKERYFMVI